MMYPILAVISFIGFVFFAGLAIIASFDRKEVRYDCQLAEFSPDFPIEAREGCRKLRMDKRYEQRNTKGDSSTSGR